MNASTSLFSTQAIALNQALETPQNVPSHIQFMNPFKEKAVFEMMEEFYKKFYADDKKRYLILGINPGRHGAGLTGIPFTDTQRLEGDCKISARGIQTREISSVFVYQVIAALGGVKKFYQNFYISSCCPLGLLLQRKQNWVNYNYYDDVITLKALGPFIESHFKNLLRLPLKTKKVFCLGTGKNFSFLKQIAKKWNFFEEVIPLSHPRYIMQYRFKKKEDYIKQYQKSLIV